MFSFLQEYLITSMPLERTSVDRFWRVYGEVSYTVKYSHRAKHTDDKTIFTQETLLYDWDKQLKYKHKLTDLSYSSDRK